MKKLFFIAISAFMMMSCTKEKEQFIEESFLEKKYQMNFSSSEISKQVINDLSIVVEGIQVSKSENASESQTKYKDFLAKQGIIYEQYMDVAKANMENEFESGEYSEEFIRFVSEYNDFISSLTEYEDYVSYINNFKLNSGYITNTEELQLATDILFTTDILYQTMIELINTPESMAGAKAAAKLKLSDEQYRCIGFMGLGVLTGCSVGGLAGCILGLGFGALSC